LSTFGQTALLIAAALLIAQVIGFFILVNERDRWRLLDAVTPAVVSFAQVARDVERTPVAVRDALMFHASGFDHHFMLVPFDGIALRRIPRQADLEDQLRRALRNAGVNVGQVEASSRGFADSPPRYNVELWHPDLRFVGPTGFRRVGPLSPPFGDPRFGPPSPPFTGGRALGPPPPPPFEKDAQEIDLATRLPDGVWLNADFRYPPPPAYFFSRLSAAEIILYAVVLAASLFVAARLARPLNELASAASRFGFGDNLKPIPVHGPREVRTAISSFNAMAARVSDLLHEKDYVIAAIGHDLRTPLAALRVRAEAVQPEAERERMVESLDEVTKIVDDILGLAQAAHTREPFAIVDLASLADSVVEEFRELGKVANFLDAPRTPLRMQQASVKRLLRNLIENAIKFGARADVSIESLPSSITLCVDDEGPGIPAALLSQVIEPFVRLEESRSRETGGIGLGLAIAKAIAHSQKAELELINREGGGLRARLHWRLSQDAP
jgi:signal transduction histidine kinase